MTAPTKLRCAHNETEPHSRAWGRRVDCPGGRPYPSNLSHQNAGSGTTTLPADSSPSVAVGEGGNPHPGEWTPPPPRTELIWAAIDLDGTIAEGVWTPDSDGRRIGRPIERNVRKYNELRTAGYKTVIWTARGWEHYEAIESWLEHHEIPFDKIVCGKLLAAVYVDDRAVESEMPGWLPATQQARQWWNRNGAWHDN